MGRRTEARNGVGDMDRVGEVDDIGGELSVKEDGEVPSVEAAEGASAEGEAQEEVAEQGADGADVHVAFMRLELERLRQRVSEKEMRREELARRERSLQERRVYASRLLRERLEAAGEEDRDEGAAMDQVQSVEPIPMLTIPLPQVSFIEHASGDEGGEDAIWGEHHRLLSLGGSGQEGARAGGGDEDQGAQVAAAPSRPSQSQSGSSFEAVSISFDQESSEGGSQADRHARASEAAGAPETDESVSIEFDDSM